MLKDTPYEVFMIPLSTLTLPSRVGMTMAAAIILLGVRIEELFRFTAFPFCECL
jgi:hypothetical protein